MKAYIKQVNGNTYAGRSDSNHWVIFDTTQENHGSNAGSSPMEMVLMALAACSSVDVELILKKKREQLDWFEVSIDAERRDEHPRVFTKIQLNFRFAGQSLNAESIQKALDLSFSKYCSVAGMLNTTAKIEYSFNIIN